MNRRHFLASASSLGALAGLGAWSHANSASLVGYRSLVVIQLSGGMDGNDLVVPIDGAYSDYSNARGGIAIQKDALKPFGTNHLGHRMGLNPAAQDLMPLFESDRLSFLINVGTVMQPTTVSQVLNRTAVLPPFLGAHQESSQIVHGWGGDEDPSGWGGRLTDALGLMPDRRPLVQMTASGPPNATGLLKSSLGRPFEFHVGHQPHLGSSHYSDPDYDLVQTYQRLYTRQGSSRITNEAYKTYLSLAGDIALSDHISKSGIEVSGSFDNNSIASRLMETVRLQRYFKALGLARQVFHIEWGQFDTHDNQRNQDSGSSTALDPQLQMLSKALVAYQASIEQAGLGDEVLTLIGSEFGRTLDPSAGDGTDHAWGNHWILMGRPFNGGHFVGDRFPRLIRGGPDDGDQGKRGYWVPQISADVLTADLARFMGVPEGKLLQVAPRLAGFTSRTIPGLL